MFSINFRDSLIYTMRGTSFYDGDAKHYFFRKYD